MSCRASAATGPGGTPEASSSAGEAASCISTRPIAACRRAPSRVKSRFCWMIWRGMLPISGSGRVRLPVRTPRPDPSRPAPSGAAQRRSPDRAPLPRSPGHRRKHRLEHGLFPQGVGDRLRAAALLAEQAPGRLAVRIALRCRTGIRRCAMQASKPSWKRAAAPGSPLSRCRTGPAARSRAMARTAPGRRHGPARGTRARPPRGDLAARLLMRRSRQRWRSERGKRASIALTMPGAPSQTAGRGSPGPRPRMSRKSRDRLAVLLRARHRARQDLPAFAGHAPGGRNRLAPPARADPLRDAADERAGDVAAARAAAGERLAVLPQPLTGPETAVRETGNEPPSLRNASPMPRTLGPRAGISAARSSRASLRPFSCGRISERNGSSRPATCGAVQPAGPSAVLSRPGPVAVAAAAVGVAAVPAAPRPSASRLSASRASSTTSRPPGAPARCRHPAPTGVLRSTATGSRACASIRAFSFPWGRVLPSRPAKCRRVCQSSGSMPLPNYPEDFRLKFFGG